MDTAAYEKLMLYLLETNLESPHAKCSGLKVRGVLKVKLRPHPSFWRGLR
jgi:hypothetical protein